MISFYMKHNSCLIWVLRIVTTKISFTSLGNLMQIDEVCLRFAIEKRTYSLIALSKYLHICSVAGTFNLKIVRLK